MGVRDILVLALMAAIVVLWCKYFLFSRSKERKTATLDESDDLSESNELSGRSRLYMNVAVLIFAVSLKFINLDSKIYGVSVESMQTMTNILILISAVHLVALIFSGEHKSK
jgi:hypothetical protein